MTQYIYDNARKYVIQERDVVYAAKVAMDGMRNKEQHEGKGKGWTCNNHNNSIINNHNMRNPIIERYREGLCML